MAATDLDPLFVRALKLLNSKSKESAAQLKAMVDEAIAQRKGLKVLLSCSCNISLFVYIKSFIVSNTDVALLM